MELNQSGIEHIKTNQFCFKLIPLHGINLSLQCLTNALYLLRQYLLFYFSVCQRIVHSLLTKNDAFLPASDFTCTPVSCQGACCHQTYLNNGGRVCPILHRDLFGALSLLALVCACFQSHGARGPSLALWSWIALHVVPAARSLRWLL